MVGQPINFNQGNIPFDVNYSTLTGLFFSGPSGLSFTFDGVANFLEGAILPNDLAIGGPGTLTLAGFDPTPALFILTTQGGGVGGFTTFSATVVAVPIPGPVVGAGLPGLLAALRRPCRLCATTPLSADCLIEDCSKAPPRPRQGDKKMLCGARSVLVARRQGTSDEGV